MSHRLIDRCFRHTFTLSTLLSKFVVVFDLKSLEFRKQMFTVIILFRKTISANGPEAFCETSIERCYRWLNADNWNTKLTKTGGKPVICAKLECKDECMHITRSPTVAAVTRIQWIETAQLTTWVVSKMPQIAWKSLNSYVYIRKANF